MANLEETFLTDLKFDKDLVRVTDEGDLETISGLDNYKAAMLRRWTTPPGALAHRPNYGAGLRDYQNAPAKLDTKRQMAKRIEEQALQDPRTESVLGVNFQTEDLSPEKTIVGVRLKPIGYSETTIEFNPFDLGVS